jgi:hypothetical protein
VRFDRIEMPSETARKQLERRQFVIGSIWLLISMAITSAVLWALRLLVGLPDTPLEKTILSFGLLIAVWIGVALLWLRLAHKFGRR